MNIKIGYCLLMLCGSISLLSAQSFKPEEINRWKQRAAEVSIIRDQWGVPHIYGKTDADAVFGLMYAQAEDDFDRVEMNYLDAIGRLAEVQGSSAIYHDLRARMFVTEAQASAYYRQSPAWLKALLEAFADGMNYFLHTHPEVKPALITRFEPWMPLTFSEGSIGGDITRISLRQMKDFYEPGQKVSRIEPAIYVEPEQTGSNGFAIAPSKSASGHALLLINPHVSFYFRNEVHVISEEGLNAYGAVTWGQFFVYQGFNEHCGWMHTSSYADVIDEYLETVEMRDGQYWYRYDGRWKPVIAETTVLPYVQNGKTYSDTLTIYRTHHGPVVRMEGNQWVSVAMMNEPLKALSQSYLRTKAQDYRSYAKVMKMRTNSSNNTVFADSKGNIGYWHGDFIPRRDPSFDWEKPLDGSDPRTDWKGLHRVKEIIHLKNPASGWIQNCNSTPYTAAGSSSPRRSDFPSYMAPEADNYRGINAARVLSSKKIFNLDTLIASANDPYLAGFEKLIPDLISSYEHYSGAGSAEKEAIGMLKGWNLCYGVNSIPTTLAIQWGEKVRQLAFSKLPPGQRMDAIVFTDYMIHSLTPEEKINSFKSTLDDLSRNFGDWKITWGEINRYQRLTGEVQESYDDSKSSIPVGFTSSMWGSLAAYTSRTFDGTKKRYGIGGNSFVAVVEFGPRLIARSVITGGESSDPDSPHFDDQAELYCNGAFKEVNFYPEDVKTHASSNYHPGEKQ